MEKEAQTIKGEFLYDYKYDTLSFKVKGRNYKRSLDFQNFTVDIDENNIITGIRIFDASHVFSTNKLALKNVVEWKFKADVQDNVVTITLHFASKLRNKLIPIISAKENYTQQFTASGDPKHPLANSTFECPAAS